MNKNKIKKRKGVDAEMCAARGQALVWSGVLVT